MRAAGDRDLVSVQDPPVQPTDTPTVVPPADDGDDDAGPSPTPVPQCSDGIDNDKDGTIDMRDKNCKSPGDNSEAN